MSENDDRESLRMEPRRPQVGDIFEMAMGENRQPVWPGGRVVLWERLSIDLIDDSSAEIYLHPEGRLGWVALSDEGITWRWPANQGAAVAGPARECPLPCVLPPGHEGLHRLSPPPPTSEPPACPTCKQVNDEARTCGNPWHLTPTELLAVQRSTLQAYDEERTALTAAKAALEVQLLNERDAHFATRVQAFADALDLARSNDALAAQLKAVLPLLVPVDNGYRRCLRCNTHSHQSDVHRHVDGCEVRAALAASGPAKEGT